LPVNINRLIWNAKNRFEIVESGSYKHAHSKYSDLNPIDCIKAVKELCDKLIVVNTHKIDPLGQEAQ
jgi:hypothetical protein